MVLKIIGAIAIGIVVLGLLGKMLEPDWDDIMATCREDMGSRMTCECVIEGLQDAGYEPEDVEGADYPPGAITAVMHCLG